MEAHNIAFKLMGESHWQEVEPAIFAAAWNAELAELPEFEDRTIHIVAGLLLPIWKRLPDESTRVYRLQADDGERIIGRRVSPAWAVNATSMGAISLTPDEAFAALIERANAAGIEASVLSPLHGDFNEDLLGLGIAALAANVRGQLATPDVARFLQVTT